MKSEASDGAFDVMVRIRPHIRSLRTKGNFFLSRQLTNRYRYERSRLISESLDLTFLALIIKDELLYPPRTFFSLPLLLHHPPPPLLGSH